MVVAGLVTVLFTADLAVGIPFRRVSLIADICFILAGLILAYLSWSIIGRTGSTR